MIPMVLALDGVWKDTNLPPVGLCIVNERKVLIIGGNRFSFHRFERMGPLLRDSLLPIGVDLELTTDRDALLELDEYDVLMDYTTDSTLTDEQLEGLVSFVAAGNGYAGVHCASDLTTTDGENREQPVKELRELLGGHFRTHPAQSSFEVNVVNSHHPVSAHLEDFRVWDEPYVLAYDDDLTVLARMDHPENGDMPVAWVRDYGEGRVFYCSLGHDYPALVNEGVVSLLQSGVRWAAGGPGGR